MRLGLELAALYVGAVVGAGFASGQEIAQFFGQHGDHALAVGVLVTVLFGLCGLLIMGVSSRVRIGDYGGLCRYALGRRVGGVYERILTGFLLIGLAVMLAGAGALAGQELGIEPRLGTLVTAGAIYVVLLRRLRGVLAANVLLVPVLAVIIVATCLGLPEAETAVPVFSGIRLPTGKHWAVSSGLYVLYNSQLAAVALIPVGQAGIRTKTAAVGSILGGVVLGGMSALMAITLSQQGALGLEVPMAAVARRLGPLWGATYGVALWCALATTGLAVAFGLQTRLARAGITNPVVSGLLFMLPAIVIADLGFARMIAVVYPLLGYLAVPFMAALALRFVMGRRRGHG